MNNSVSEETQIFAIQVEKRLCELLDWQWRPSGMSIETLTLEIAKRLAALEGSSK